MRRRSLVPVALASLATCAWLHARGLSALAGGTLAVPGLAPIAEAHAAVEPQRARSADPILARNPFDSVTGPLGPSRAPDGPSPPVPEEADDVGPCDDVRAVSIVTFAEPEWSFAMLDVPGEPRPLLQRRGGLVRAIGLDRVLVERGGRRCVARMFAPAAPFQAPRPPAAPAIVRTGAGSFALDRSARDRLMDGAADLTRSVTVQPERVGDDVVGLRIAALKPGTALDALGLRAGDVLESIDGIPLTAPDHMLEAYARARTEEHVRVVILRGGKEQQLDIDVR